VSWLYPAGVRRVVLILILLLPAQSLVARAQPSRGQHDPDEDDPEGGARGETVVTASRGPESAFESPRAVTALRRATIAERAPATTPEALEDQDSVSMQRTNSAGGAPILRGLLGQHVLLLVDGVRLNTAITRHGPNQLLNTVDPFQIQRAEVLRGPGSVLHGSDALGGVINLLSRRPTFDPRRAWDASGEGVLRFDSADLGVLGNLAGEGHLRGVGLRAGGSLKRFDDLTGGRGTGSQPFTAYSEGDADLSAAWVIDDANRLRLSYALVRQTDAPRTDRSSPADFLRFSEQFRDLVALRYDGWFEGDALQRASATLSFHSQRELRERFQLAPDGITRERDDVAALGAQLTLRSELPHNRLTYGFDLYHDWIASGAETEPVSRRADPTRLDRGRYVDGSRMLRLGVYAMDRITLGRRARGLALDLGLRFNTSDVRIPGQTAADPAAAQPAVGATRAGVVGSLHGRYLIGDGLNIVAGVSQGFREPNVDDYSALGCSGQGYDVPNTDLAPEQGLTAEAGVKLDLAGIVRGSLFYFFTYLHGLIVRVPVPSEPARPCGRDPVIGGPVMLPVTRRENARQGTIHGLELSLRADLGSRWRAYTWAAWARGDATLDTPGAASEPLSRVPPVNGLVGLRFKIHEVRGFAELTLRWAGPQTRLSSGDLLDRRICPAGPVDCPGTPGYAVLTLRGAARVLEQLRVILSLENLTHASYRVHGSGLDGPGISAVVGLEGTVP
jgi:outer membrane receptor protein involved in Fe transport